MKAYKIDPMKRAVVGILLVILTLGFCVVGTGAARPDMPPMDREQGFGPGGSGRQGGPMERPDFDGETPPELPELPEGESFPEGAGPDGGAAFDGQFPRDGRGGPDGQRGFGGRGGAGRHGADEALLTTIEALEDEETKASLKTLLENVHSAMEALMQADDEGREAAETAVKEARDALNQALEAAGIDDFANQPPEMPDDGMRFAPRGGTDIPEAPEENKT